MFRPSNFNPIEGREDIIAHNTTCKLKIAKHCSVVCRRNVAYITCLIFYVNKPNHVSKTTCD